MSASPVAAASGSGRESPELLSPQRISAAFRSLLSHAKGSSKTFRPIKSNYGNETTLRYQTHKKAEKVLEVSVDLAKAVWPGDDDVVCIEEWFVVHILDFYNRLSLVYGLVMEYCSPDSCPKMTGGDLVEYKWQDKNAYRKATSMAACDYISLLMTWIEERLDDRSVFPDPSDIHPNYSKKFHSTVEKIYTRMYRCFVHIYYHHFRQLRDIGAEAHFNTLYKHFYIFVFQHQLVKPKEMEPLDELSRKLVPVMKNYRKTVDYGSP